MPSQWLKHATWFYCQFSPLLWRTKAFTVLTTMTQNPFTSLESKHLSFISKAVIRSTRDMLDIFHPALGHSYIAFFSMGRANWVQLLWIQWQSEMAGGVSAHVSLYLGDSVHLDGPHLAIKPAQRTKRIRASIDFSLKSLETLTILSLDRQVDSFWP